MTVSELYKYLLVNYGKRRSYLSDIASGLGITKKQAHCLTHALGYRRGKATAITRLITFSQDPKVIAIHSMILKCP